MLLSDTKNHGLVQNLDRISGTTVNIYSFKAKMSDLNDSLDWYFALAFKAGLNWELDDFNNTSPPIDTQNLVSGTNRYKFNSFTEKVVNLIKLEVNGPSGNALSLYPETLDSFGNVVGNTSGRIGIVGNGSFDDIYVNASSGTPTHYIKYGDFVYLRPKPNYNLTSGLKAYFNRPASKFNFVTFTVTIASPAVFSATAHGLIAGDTVILETDGALPTGLTADTQYYVISGGLTADAFELSTTLGGSVINTSGSQSGNHAFLKTNASPGINSMHHLMLVRRAALTYLTYINSPKIGFLPVQVQNDERVIGEYFSKRDKDIRKSLIPRVSYNR